MLQFCTQPGAPCYHGLTFYGPTCFLHKARSQFSVWREVRWNTLASEQTSVLEPHAAESASLLEVATERPLSTDEVAREQQQYAAQFVQLDREAWYTLGAALITTVLFWATIALTHDILITVGYLPLWFALSCLGGYVFSVVIVVALVKWCLKPCRLKVASYQELHPKED